MRAPASIALGSLLALGAACAPATQSTGGAPGDRVLMTDMQGTVLRQSALSDRATARFAAPVSAVWPAVLTTFADLGIEANYAEQANGRYGVRNYTFPKKLHGERIGAYFGCGESLTGALVDNGTVTADIVVTVTPAADGGTNGVIYVAGWGRRNDGNVANQVACSSTGHLEETIRKSIEGKIATK